MKAPRVISTLVEAAQWMTEATGTEWTSESLLDYIFRKMGALLDEEIKKVKADCQEAKYKEAKFEASLYPISCLEISLHPRTRVVYRYCDGTLEKCERGETPLLALDDYDHVYALLQHGAIELPYPLRTDPWDDEEGYFIDADTAPIITPESLRIGAWSLERLPEIFNEQNKKEVALTSIDELDLKVHTSRYLGANNIYSVKELTMCSKKDLLEIPEVGRIRINDIRRKLALRGLKLDGEKLDIEMLVNLNPKSCK